MTRNQISYWELQETKRHNTAGEDETKRHNVTTESETQRHNVMGEKIDLGKLNETIRHNKRTEGQTDQSLGLQAANLGEVQRHNLASENLGYGQLDLGYNTLAETGRHNMATEFESQRHNVANEGIQSDLNITTGSLNEARANLANAQAQWEGLLRQGQYEYTQAQKNAIIKQLQYAQQNANAATINAVANVVRSSTGAAQTIGELTKLLGR